MKWALLFMGLAYAGSFLGPEFGPEMINGGPAKWAVLGPQKWAQMSLGLRPTKEQKTIMK